MPKLQIARQFGYSRKSYYNISDSVLNGSIQDSDPHSTGPKSAPKRTKELEVLVIKLRFETEDNMYEITAKLTRIRI